MKELNPPQLLSEHRILSFPEPVCTNQNAEHVLACDVYI